MKVLAGVGCGAVALLILLGGLFTIFVIVAFYMSFLSQNATATTGTVVGIRTWTESGDTYHSPDVRFTTEDGRPFTVNLWCPPFGCFAESGIGSQVPVVYLKNLPEVAIADTFAGRWVSPLLIIVVASVMTLVGAAGLVSARAAIRAGVYWERGTRYLESGDYDRAIADYVRLIECKPKDASAYKERGLAYYKKNNLDQAIQDWTQALRLDPNCALTYRNRANAYYQQGLKSKALADYRLCIGISPNGMYAPEADRRLRELE